MMKTVTAAGSELTAASSLCCQSAMGASPTWTWPRSVNLTPTPCLERVQPARESEGFITGYVALLDPVKANAALCAYIEVQLDQHHHRMQFESF